MLDWITAKWGILFLGAIIGMVVRDVLVRLK